MFEKFRKGELSSRERGVDKIDRHQRSEKWLEVLRFIDIKVRPDSLSIEPEIWRLQGLVIRMLDLEDQIAASCPKSQDGTHLVEEASLRAIEDLYYHAIQALTGNEEESRNYGDCHRSRFHHKAPNPFPL